MATQTMVPSASVQAKAAVLLHERAGWTFYRREGVPMIAMPSGEHVYAVRRDGRGCECLAYKKSEGRLLCSHRLAAIEAANHDALSTWISEIAAHSTASSADGWQPETPAEVAAWSAHVERVKAEPTPKVRKSYNELMDNQLVDAF